MALNWQDVAQVRFQDTTQAAKNISDSLSSLGDPLQGVIDSQTEDRQNALDSAIAQQQMQAQRMSAMASGMNAQANMLDIQRQLDPAYIDMQNRKTEAGILQAEASAGSSRAAQKLNELKYGMFNTLTERLNNPPNTNTTIPVSPIGDGFPTSTSEGTAVTAGDNATISLDGAGITLPANGEVTPTSNIFESTKSNYNLDSYNYASGTDSIANMAGVNTAELATYKNSRDNAFYSILDNAVQNFSSVKGTDRDKLFKDTKSSLESLNINSAAKQTYSTYLDTALDNLRTSETTITTRNADNFRRVTQASINNPDTAPKSFKEWGTTLTALHAQGGYKNKSAAATDLLPQLMKFAVQEIKLQWQGLEYIAPGSELVSTNQLRQGDADENLALDLIKNPKMKVMMHQLVQNLGLPKDMTDTILDSLNDNLGVTTMEANRDANHLAATENLTKYTKNKAIRIKDNDRSGFINDVLNSDKQINVGAKKDLGHLINYLHGDSELLRLGYRKNPDLLYQALRMLNPSAEDDDFTDIANEITSDFAIGTLAPSDDIFDPTLRNLVNQPTGILKDVLAGTATFETIMDNQWRTENTKDQSEIIAVVIKELLSQRKVKEDTLRNEINNWK
jgi:hypothetical protein